MESRSQRNGVVVSCMNQPVFPDFARKGAHAQSGKTGRFMRLETAFMYYTTATTTSGHSVNYYRLVLIAGISFSEFSELTSLW